jgi:hypothetical protein
VAGFLARHRLPPPGLAAAAIVAAELLARVVSGEPYPGATLLLVTACGLALLPFVPRAIDTPTLRFAVLPALGIGGFSVLLVTVSIVGIPMTEATVRLAVLAFVVVALAAATRFEAVERGSWSPRHELVVGAVLLGLVTVALASGWDVAYPLQVRGTDLGHYLLYADQVAAQEQLLAMDPYAGEERLFADPASVGALYGSSLILDGISSWTLGAGLVVLSAVSVLSVFVAAGALWGSGAGLVAAAMYAVAPIRLDPMYWHGLGTTLALVFLPLAVLALGLLYRGRRDTRTIALLALALVAVAAAHSTSAIIAAALVAVALLVDLLRRPRAPRSWWRDGLGRPVLVAVAAALLVGLGVVAHLREQAADLGQPVDPRFLGTDWLDRAAVGGYFSWRFLLAGAVALVLILSSRHLRRDPALLALLALACACVLVSESWRVGFPFEYRRVVYPFGIGIALLLGVASLRFRPRPAWIAAWTLAIVAVAQLSVGLRLPQRVLDGAVPDPASVVGLRELREQLDDGRLPDGQLLVTDSCLHFGVAYLVRRPTIPAYGERQVGFENRLPLARKAATVLQGGSGGRELAQELGVDYAVVDPRCTPGVAERLDGTVVLENEELEVVLIPSTTEER